VEKAAREKDVSETVLIPARIQKAEIVRPVEEDSVVPFTPRPETGPESNMSKKRMMWLRWKRPQPTILTALSLKRLLSA